MRSCRGRSWRFIPARAGNTGPCHWATRAVSVHPRSRGEHSPSRSSHRRAPGSSPLARGTRAHPPGQPRADRFIPARAGNTGGEAGQGEGPAVHPRSRGEHHGAREDRQGGVGSSPLARGTLVLVAASVGHRRFIPARAGNTLPRPCPPTATPVHPRSRGEHVATPSSRPPTSGSSPLARGTLVLVAASVGHRRFIPARAGNTDRSGARGRPHPVHPRSRGEHGAARIVRVLDLGSSPLARGTPEGGHPERGAERFIPARAGNTRTTPRLTRIDAGSSPLARGTPITEKGVVLLVRFIPARAGNTSWSGIASCAASVHPRSRGEHSLEPRR